MKYIKGPSAWFKHQVCTFILDADQIKQPDDSRLALLKALALPLPANSTSLGLWLAQLANALQKFASYQGDFFAVRTLGSKNSLIIAFAYLEEDVARVESTLFMLSKLRGNRSCRFVRVHPQ